MEWKHNFVADRNLLVVRATGKFSVVSFEKMLREILSDKQWVPGMDCLVDHSLLDLTETSYDDIRTAAGLHRRYDTWIGKGRIAVVFGREDDYDLGLLYETLLGSDVLAVVRSFRTADDARNWLAQPASVHTR